MREPICNSSLSTLVKSAITSHWEGFTKRVNASNSSELAMKGLFIIIISMIIYFELDLKIISTGVAIIFTFYKVGTKFELVAALKANLPKKSKLALHYGNWNE